MVVGDQNKSEFNRFLLSSPLQIVLFFYVFFT